MDPQSPHRTYTVYLERESTGSSMKLSVVATSRSDASSTALDTLNRKMWSVVGITIPDTYTS